MNLAPFHVSARVSRGRFNLCSPRQEAFFVEFFSLPVGLPRHFILGDVDSSFGSDHGDELKDFENEDRVHEPAQIQRLLELPDLYCRKYCLFNSESAKARDLFLWTQINRDRLYEAFIRWEQWDLERQMKILSSRITANLYSLRECNLQQIERLRA